MAYNYLTQYDSPNYTPASQTASVWGVNRSLQHIDIHWWGDPNTNPSFEGVVAHLCNPTSGVSAHFVATGTGRRVACLVSPADNSWATVQDNPYSISIECDPRCRDEDYDVVAELIADIRSAYGANLSLHPHREFIATTCPGNWDLARLDALSKTKVSQAQWGDVTNKNTPPAKKTATADEVKQAYLDILERPADAAEVAHYTSNGMTIDQVRADLTASTEHSILVNNKAKAQAAAQAAADAAEAKKKQDALDQQIADQKADADKAKELADEQAKAQQTADSSFIQRLKDLITNIIKFFTDLRGK